MEQTYLMVKPDGVQRGLVGEIITRFEKRGFKLLALKVLVPTREKAGEHYAEHKERPFYGGLVSYLSSGPVVAMVWEGAQVISTARAMIGATKPTASAPGTIRGDYAIEMGRNIIHGSDSSDSAAREIKLWFSSEEIASWEPTMSKWIYE
mmetsp:Transcript_10013/g.26718  ORF Transcript_10013/g.26718 Transcript_10013/m.26718 type:complete len:150 (-) Transcript_10013:2718-3167(-)